MPRMLRASWCIKLVVMVIAEPNGNVSAALYGRAKHRKEISDVLIHPTLGAWWVSSPEQRISHIVEMAKEKGTKPDFAPIDMVSAIADVYDPERRAFLTDETVYFNTTKTLRFF